MVPAAGLEPARPCGQGILNPMNNPQYINKTPQIRCLIELWDAK